MINVVSYTDAKLVAFDKASDKAKNLAFKAKAAAEADKILKAFAQDLQKDASTALPENVSARKDLMLARGGQELSPALSQSIFAMPKDEGKAYVIGSDHDNAALAVLQKIGENEQASGDQYKTFINSQMVQIKSGEANSMLYKGARELQKITYNDDAIKMVIQQDSVDK